MAASDEPLSQPGDFDAVRKSIVDLLKQPEYDDGSAGPVLVRLAWYATLPPRAPSFPFPFSFFLL